MRHFKVALYYFTVDWFAAVDCYYLLAVWIGLNISTWTTIRIWRSKYLNDSMLHTSSLYLIGLVFWSDWVLVYLTEFLKTNSVFQESLNNIDLFCTDSIYLFVGSMKIRALKRWKSNFCPSLIRPSFFVSYFVFEIPQDISRYGPKLLKNI